MFIETVMDFVNEQKRIVIIDIQLRYYIFETFECAEKDGVFVLFHSVLYFLDIGSTVRVRIDFDRMIMWRKEE